MKKLVSVFLVLCMALACPTALAEETAGSDSMLYVTDDGVLSIEAPNENWVAFSDANFWFAMSDGDDYILIDHVSNGESLPETMVADDEFAAVYHAYVSTRNEVFVITGCATEQAGLKEIMEAIATIKILKFDTKQAINKNEPVASGYTVKPYDAVLYCNSSQLNVRSSWSVKSPRLGSLKKGQSVQVTGIVLLDGADYGWYCISYKGGTAYVSAKYMSTKKPGSSTKKTQNNQNSSGGSSYALDTAPGMNTQDPAADGGYALDTAPGMNTQDPAADGGYALDTPPGMDTQDPNAD